MSESTTENGKPGVVLVQAVLSARWVDRLSDMGVSLITRTAARTNELNRRIGTGHQVFELEHADISSVFVGLVGAGYILTNRHMVAWVDGRALLVLTYDLSDDASSLGVDESLEAALAELFGSSFKARVFTNPPNGAGYVVDAVYASHRQAGTPSNALLAGEPDALEFWSFASSR